MKVAMIDPSAFTPPYDHHLCDGLSAVGCNVTLFTTEFEYVGWTGELSYQKREFYYSLTNRLYSDRSSSWHRKVLKGGEHVVNSALLLRELKQLRPDVIHVQWLPLPAVDQFFVERLKEIAPVVHTVHDSTPYHGATPSRLQVLGVESAPKRFDRLIVHTDEAERTLAERGIQESDISVVPHGIIEYPDAKETGRNASKKPRDETVVLLFGGIKHYKGIDVLLRAFSELRPSVRNEVVVKIAGSSSISVRELQTLADELGIESHVEWDVRYVPDEEVPELFNSADVVAFPYRNADQSGALMTALPYGKPIVASNLGGFAEVLEEGTHGHLVEPEDTEALSKALEDLLSDETKRRQMGEAVRKLSTTTYSWQKIAEQTLDVYDHVKSDMRA